MQYVKVPIIQEQLYSLQIMHSFKELRLFLQNYNARLADFGFAKDGPTADKSHLTASIRRTYGYLAPKYMKKGGIHYFMYAIDISEPCKYAYPAMFLWTVSVLLVCSCRGDDC